MGDLGSLLLSAGQGLCTEGHLAALACAAERAGSQLSSCHAAVPAEKGKSFVKRQRALVGILHLQSPRQVQNFSSI